MGALAEVEWYYPSAVKATIFPASATAGPPIFVFKSTDCWFHAHGVISIEERMLRHLLLPASVFGTVMCGIFVLSLFKRTLIPSPEAHEAGELLTVMGTLKENATIALVVFTYMLVPKVPSYKTIVWWYTCARLLCDCHMPN